MRAFAIVGLACWLAAPAAAAAQSAPIVVPPAPPLVAAPSAPQVVQPAPTAQMPAAGTLAPPGIGQSPPASGANADTGNAAAAGATPATPPPPSWLPGTTAQLGVLNEVDGSVSQVQIPVGGQARIGDLQVNVLACLRRPPDQLPDAAAFIAAQTTAPGPAPDQAASPPQDDAAPTNASPPDQNGTDPSDESAQPATIYRGWMLRSAPGAAVVGDAAETFRIIDCN